MEGTREIRARDAKGKMETGSSCACEGSMHVVALPWHTQRVNVYSQPKNGNIGAKDPNRHIRELLRSLGGDAGMCWQLRFHTTPDGPCNHACSQPCFSTVPAPASSSLLSFSRSGPRQRSHQHRSQDRVQEVLPRLAPQSPANVTSRVGELDR